MLLNNSDVFTGVGNGRLLGRRKRTHRAGVTAICSASLAWLETERAGARCLFPRECQINQRSACGANGHRTIETSLHLGCGVRATEAMASQKVSSAGPISLGLTCFGRGSLCTNWRAPFERSPTDDHPRRRRWRWRRRSGSDAPFATSSPSTRRLAAGRTARPRALSAGLTSRPSRPRRRTTFRGTRGQSPGGNH